MAGKNVVTTKLFVGGLPPGCNQSELQSLFAKYGKVAECDIVRDYAFVHFEDPAEARTAVTVLDNSQFHGSTIKVQMSHSRVRQKPGMGEEGKCYRCGAMGHWTKECPMQPREGRSRQSQSYRRPPPSERNTYAYADGQGMGITGYAPAAAVRAPNMGDWGAQYGASAQYGAGAQYSAGAQYGAPAPAPAPVAGPYADRYHPYAARPTYDVRRALPVAQTAPTSYAPTAYAQVDEYGRPTPEYYTQHYYSSLAETTYAVPQGNPPRY